MAQPTPVWHLAWRDVTAEGLTDLGAALTLTAAALATPPMPERALPPVLILVSDGRPTDDFEAGLDRLRRSRWGGRAVRLAVAIGRDADLDVLQSFLGEDGARRLVEADSPDDLIAALRWASSTALAEASRMRSAATSRPLPDASGMWRAARP